MPETENYQEKTATATVCVETLQQALLAYSCLYTGIGTLMINLLNQSAPHDHYNEPWQAQYGDGSGNEIYSCQINPIFIGKSFSKVSWLLYKCYQMILFGVKIYIAKKDSYHIALNPGKDYLFQAKDELLFIAQDETGVIAMENIVS